MSGRREEQKVSREAWLEEAALHVWVQASEMWIDGGSSSELWVYVLPADR
jgi:hypothetical protein